jgi:hypothetical protein
VRRLLLLGILLALILLGAGLRAGGDAFELTAQVTSTDQEADEGYFSLGQSTMIVARQGSDLHTWLKRHAGQRVKLMLDVDSKSN